MRGADLRSAEPELDPGGRESARTRGRILIMREHVRVDLRAGLVDLGCGSDNIDGAPTWICPRSRVLMTDPHSPPVPMLEVLQPQPARGIWIERAERRHPLLSYAARQDPIIERASSTMTRSTQGVKTSAPGKGGACR